MPSIKLHLYLWTISYYIITFIIPFFLTFDDCSRTFKPELYYIYFGYSVLNSIWEIYQVLKIQRYVKESSILKFNKWHFVELLMGLTARLDTFLTVCFAILISHCAEAFMPYLVPTTIFIGVNLIFPFTMLIRNLKNKNGALCQPYLECCCFLSFIRENMLLLLCLTPSALTILSTSVVSNLSLEKSWVGGPG